MKWGFMMGYRGAAGKERDEDDGEPGNGFHANMRKKENVWEAADVSGITELLARDGVSTGA